LPVALSACSRTTDSSELSAADAPERLTALQDVARKLLSEQVASIQAAPLLDTQERYAGGSASRERATLQDLVRNLGNMMMTSYLAAPGKGLEDLKFPGSTTRVLRDAHPKGLICLDGSFEVKPNSIFQSGFLGTPGRYEATVRFSSSSPSVQPDSTRDIRGFAVQVDTKGSPFQGAASSHDFVNLSAPVFPSDTSADFLDLVKSARIAKCGEDPRGFAACAADTGLPNPLSLAASAAKFASIIANEPQNSLLEKTFFGVTPYKYEDGSLKTYFKFRFDPIVCADVDRDDRRALEPSDAQSFFAAQVRNILARQPACYELKIVTLKQTNQPNVLEQHTRTWEELGVANPAVSVATLRFEQNAPELDPVSCDKLTFSPDHRTAGFSPLGSLNRARGLVYAKLAEFRLRLNAEIAKAGL
jgi:catalase